MCKLTLHYRRPHKVRGHFRNCKGGRVWIPEHERGGTWVNDHCYPGFLPELPS